MATRRIVVVALILVALTAVPVEPRRSSGKKGGSLKIASALAKAFKGKGAAAGDSPVMDDAADAASDIISNAASDAMIAVADKYMKKADVADSPEKAAEDQKDAVESVASALALAMKGAQTTPDAHKQAASPSSDDAAKLANAIVSDAASRAHIEAADKYMKEAAAADSPEKAAVAKKAAAENIAAAMAYAVQGGAAVAPAAAADKSVN